MTPYSMDELAKRYLINNSKRREPNGLTVNSFLAYHLSNAKRKEYGGAVKTHVERYCTEQGAHQGKSRENAVAWYPALMSILEAL